VDIGNNPNPTNLVITQRSEGLQALVPAAIVGPYESRKRDSKVLFAPVVVPPPRSVPLPAPLRSAVVPRCCRRSSFEDRIEQSFVTKLPMPRCSPASLLDRHVGPPERKDREDTGTPGVFVFVQDKVSCGQKILNVRSSYRSST